MAETIAQFFDRVTGNTSPSYRPEPWYNPYGDCIHYHWKPDEFYREWVDDKLTVYRSVADHEAVGCEIKGVSALARKLGELGISLKEGDGTPLALFVFASQTTGGDESAYDPKERQKTYCYIIEHVGKQKVEVQELVES